MLLDIYTSYDPYRPMLAFIEKYKTEIPEWTYKTEILEWTYKTEILNEKYKAEILKWTY